MPSCEKGFCYSPTHFQLPFDKACLHEKKILNKKPAQAEHNCNGLILVINSNQPIPGFHHTTNQAIQPTKPFNLLQEPLEEELQKMFNAKNTLKKIV